MVEWAIEKNVTCAVCPECAFTFDASHIDWPIANTYTCPECGCVGEVPEGYRLAERTEHIDGSSGPRPWG